MRKVIFFNLITLDGYFEGPNRDINWHHVDEAWIAMSGFVVVFATSVLEEKAIRSDMDWSFLIALGAMVGFGDILTESGLTTLIVNTIKPYLALFSDSKVLLLVNVASQRGITTRCARRPRG